MSQAITKITDIPQFANHPGLLVAQAVFTTEAYTNGTGVSVDLAAAVPRHRDFGSVRSIIAVSSLGHTIYATKAPTASQPFLLNLRMFNGTTEIANSNISPTIIITLHSATNQTV